MDIDVNKKSHNVHFFRGMLTCEYCKRVFQSPVVLPCGETVCTRDIKDMYLEDNVRHIITCYFCGKHHHCENPYPANKIVESFLQHNLANFNLGKTYEHARQSIENLKERLNTYEKLVNNPAEFMYEFFENISKIIQLKNRSFKALSDLICEKMLKDLNLFKNECQNALDSTILKFLPDKMNKIELDDLKQKVDTWFSEILKPPGVYENKWNQIYIESQSAQNDLDRRIKSIKDCLFLNIDCKFEEKQVDLDSNLFGELKLEYPEVESAKSNLKLRQNSKKHKRQPSREEIDFNTNLIESELLKKQISSEPEIFILNPKE